MAIVTTKSELEKCKGAISLDTIAPELLKELDNPIQPEETEELKKLKESFKDIIAEVLDKDKTADSALLEMKIKNLERVYGGEVRFYQRFYIARKGDMPKAEKMMKLMVQKRFEVLGERLVSAVVSENFDEEEQKLFSAISKYWPLEFFGFSEKGNLIMTAKLKDIKPGEFIKKFTKEEISRYYLHFMDTGSLLIRVSNSKPFSEPTIPEDQEEDGYLSKLVYEIHDFEGCSRKQFHMSGLKVLKDVLSIGQGVYPEQVQRSYLINAPWFMTFAVSVISVVLDKATKAKIVVKRNDCKDQILELLGGNEELYGSLWERALRKTA